MMRVMERVDEPKSKLKVIKHVILMPNMWEYYVIEPEEGDSCDDDTFFSLVMGFEIELGYCSWSEIKPYILMETTNLNNIMPATGYRWSNV